MGIRDRYNLSNLRRAVDNPRFVRGEISRLGTKFNSKVYTQLIGEKTTDFIKQDWDNLIILDACRLDAYREVTKETTDYRISKGTESWDFMSKNFQGKELHDTVYVTANPFATRLKQNTFFALEHLIESNWNDDLGTVMPSDVVDAAINFFGEYPNKRYVIHFMQPHYPFIGPKGKKINHTGYNRNEEDRNSAPPNIWWILQYGRQDYDGVTRKNVWEAYKENLEIVLDHVDTLIGEIPGKTVITADHGTMIGDRIYPIPFRGYGHAHGAFVPPVVKVPWDIHENGDRRTIKEDTPVDRQDLQDETVNERLRMLGYQ